jgi:N-ethylmaleimide reductase
MPPLTRSRADENGVPTALMETYYRQRAGAGLIISEGTVVSPQGSAYPRVPGLYSQEQVRAWRHITSAVHQEGALIYAQLWHVGRQSHSSVQPDRLPPAGPSAIPIVNYQYRSRSGPVAYEVPRMLTHAEIGQIVEDYAMAAENAVAAGFDGVELHAANGYLIDQFLNSGSNTRSDEYGGSVVNRMRLLHEVVDAMNFALPRDRIGVRLSPSSNWMDMNDPDKEGLYSAVAKSLSGTGLSYLHLVEPEIAGSTTVEAGADAIPTGQLSRLFDGPVIITGGHNLESATRLIEDGVADLVGFGRLFMANPDLPERFRTGAPLRQPTATGFYAGGSEGYVDYPSLADEAKWADLQERIRAGHVHPQRIHALLAARPLPDLLRSGDHYLYTRLDELLQPAAAHP